MSDYQPRNILVTGGAGFIGSNFIRQILAQRPDIRIVNLDLLTYAGNLDNVEDLLEASNHIFVRGSILDRSLVTRLLEQYQIDAIAHFAAESHVDRSIAGPEVFIATNIQGTLALLECARAYGQIQRFIQISTDEVYGALALDTSDRFREDTPIAPRSPYSVSKASSDMLALAWRHTYDLPVLITRCSNNYGPHQFPEKLIPLMIHNAMHDKTLPVYGDGLNVRDWIYVTDHCDGIWTVLTKGRIGEVYNIGSDHEEPNIEMVRLILDLLGKPHSLIQYVPDRPGHDRRYAIDASKIRKELGWEPQVPFSEGIRRTIQWYADNQLWLERIASGAYRRNTQALSGQA